VVSRPERGKDRIVIPADVNSRRDVKTTSCGHLDIIEIIRKSQVITVNANAALDIRHDPFRLVHTVDEHLALRVVVEFSLHGK
jgi:hypothetical protein